MITYTGHQQRLNKFISEIAFGDLEKNAIRAADYAGIPKENKVYPFDENRIYPTQTIEQKINYEVY